jgi:hypothetical protein
MRLEKSDPSTDTQESASQSATTVHSSLVTSSLFQHFVTVHQVTGSLLQVGKRKAFKHRFTRLHC